MRVILPFGFIRARSVNHAFGAGYKLDKLQQTVQFCPLFLLAFFLAGNSAALRFSRCGSTWESHPSPNRPCKCLQASGTRKGHG
jgi:hypothetical protein